MAVYAMREVVSTMYSTDRGPSTPVELTAETRKKRLPLSENRWIVAARSEPGTEAVIAALSGQRIVECDS